MKIKFKVAPKGRDYKVDQIVEFKGAIDEAYAMKYVARGWAEPVDAAAISAADKVKVDEEARAKAEADQNARDAAAQKAKVASEAAGTPKRTGL